MKNESKIDAKNALEMMGQGQAQLTKAALRNLGNYMILWGAIYLLVPFLIHWTPSTAVLTANGLVLLGVIVTAVMGIKDPVKSDLDSTMWKFWFVAFFFAFIWAMLLGGRHFPDLKVYLNGRQTWAFGVTIAMMVFVLTGLLEKSKAITLLGFGVTLLTMVAFISEWAWSVFWFWMAACSGIPLLAFGVWAKTANPHK